NRHDSQRIPPRACGDRVVDSETGQHFSEFGEQDLLRDLGCPPRFHTSECQMRRLFPLLSLPFLLGGCASIDRAAHVATGFASHQLCSATFVSKVDPEAFYREAIAPTGGPVKSLISHSIDRERGEVIARFAGLAE